MTDYRIGNLALGIPPRVVGTLCERQSLPCACPTDNRTCDIIEVRLDCIGPDTQGWLRDCQSIESAGFPVVLTLRSAREGGKWKSRETERESLLSVALDGLASIDIEWSSKLRDPLCRQAIRAGKSVIISHHNFKGTPSFRTLNAVLERILDIPCAIPKISTMINTKSDIGTLKRLLEAHSERPCCVIGMGSKGIKTRALFPCLGSCLAYGYLDSPIAPGQVPSRVLVKAIRELNAACKDRNT